MSGLKNSHSANAIVLLCRVGVSQAEVVVRYCARIETLASALMWCGTAELALGTVRLRCGTSVVLMPTPPVTPRTTAAVVSHMVAHGRTLSHMSCRVTHPGAQRTRLSCAISTVFMRGFLAVFTHSDHMKEPCDE